MGAYLVKASVSYDDEEGTLVELDAILYQNSDPLVYFLFHPI